MSNMPLYIIKKYLYDNDYNSLLYTTKLYYKNETKFLNLNFHYTKQYANINTFHEIVNSRVYNKLNQIGLNVLINVVDDVVDDNEVNDENYNELTEENNILVHSIKLISSPIDIFDNFIYIQNLTLIDCNYILKLPKFTNLKKLKLVRCKYINNISTLTQLTNIILDSCNNISNIQSLINIKYMILSNCDKIIDISSLYNVKEIYLSDQISITDISSLKNADTVSLNNCSSINNLSVLSSVNMLILSNMNILNISDLIKIPRLIINNCTIELNNNLNNYLYKSKFINNNI